MLSKQDIADVIPKQDKERFKVLWFYLADRPGDDLLNPFYRGFTLWLRLKNPDSGLVFAEFVHNPLYLLYLPAYL